MSQERKTGSVDSPSTLPAQPIVACIWRLTVTGALATFGYGIFVSAGKGYCPGGFTSDGTVLDGNGRVTEVLPSCVNLTLEPSGLIYIAIIAIVLIAINAALRRATDLPSALRHLDRAAIVIVSLAIASVIVSQIRFSLIPITDWNGSGTFFYPFPFGAVHFETTPMPMPMPMR